MTHDGAETFILPLIRELTGKTKCIWANQNAPKPPHPYLSLRLSPERGIGTESRRRKDGSGIIDVVEQKEVTLSINGYGAGVIEKLNTLWQSLQRPTIVDRCFVAGLAFVRAEAVQDLTELLDGRNWEESANLDLIVTYSRAVTDEPGFIEDVRITGELGETDPVTPETDEAIVEVTISMKGVQ